MEPRHIERKLAGAACRPISRVVPADRRASVPVSGRRDGVLVPRERHFKKSKFSMHEQRVRKPLFQKHLGKSVSIKTGTPRGGAPCFVVLCGLPRDIYQMHFVSSDGFSYAP